MDRLSKKKTKMSILFVLLCTGIALVIVGTGLELRKRNKPVHFCSECKFYSRSFYSKCGDCRRIPGQYLTTMSTDKACKSFKPK